MLELKETVLRVSLEEAIEANLFEYSMYLGQVNHGEAFSSPEIKWVKSGGAVFNRILNSRFRVEQSADCVRETLARFKSGRVPVSWLTGPTTQPANLGQVLQKNGLIYRGNWAGMAVNLNDLQKKPPERSGLAISKVNDKAGLKLWIETACQGFQFSSQMTQAYHALFANLQLDDACPWNLYIASINRQPVATGSLFTGAGVAGIYWMATMPSARRRGIGTWLTNYLLQEAQAANYGYVVLHATALGEPIYRQLKFREYCKIGIYTWSPESKLTQLAARVKARLHRAS